MSPYQLTAIGVRLFALWLFLYAASAFFGEYFAARSALSSAPPYLLWLAIALVSSICALLWFFPYRVARTIVPAEATQSETSLAFDSWFSVGCSLIGVWALAKSIPALASYFIINYLGYRLYPDSFSVNSDWPLYVAFNIFQLAFGVWLFLGAKGLRKALLWAQSR